MKNKAKHITVLLNETIENLKIKKNGIYIDGTFGCGGHTNKILNKLNEYGRIFVIDKDPKAIEIAKQIKDHRIKVIHGSFSMILKYAIKFNIIKKIDGIILDLGMSSMQISDKNRGFSFLRNSYLDMRMDDTQGITAAEWLQKSSEKEISQVLKNLGEERYAKKIAKAIVKKNKISPIKYTKELVEIIKNSTPKKDKNKNPATRSFQAIRIFINNELSDIKIALKDSLKILKNKGRILTISFHSLEDRIIKHFMINNSKQINLPKDIPLTKTQLDKINPKILKIIGRIFPSKNEIKNNIRARSAILRIAELNK
ncbi:16S rRNA (cytosine(1402)-N(4))-methyltransferase RsmH [Buchnera aphidicola (Neophyllaphis podocarpi)]|uniref:16S rRNA (cytosine(1402)-N(4))-methyltransferase RsmH n=1 Tax=Buchnera aphidicola TaxID=9 RepID=UPI0031B7F8E9